MRTTLCLMLVAVLLGGCLPVESGPAEAAEPAYWPTDTWQSTTPEAQGMDSAPLADMLEKVSAQQTRIRSVLVIRNGYLVAETYFHPYTRDTKIHIQSVTKSVIDMLVGKAIGDGLIPGEQEQVLRFFTERVAANIDTQKDAIQLKHLLSMSSGLDCPVFYGEGPHMEQSEDWVQFMLDRPMTALPGKQFGYCNGNAHLLSAILEKSTGMSTRQYANRELFKPLGIPEVGEADWDSDPQSITNGGFGLHLRPVDLARLGLLYLQRGKWDKQQIIPAEWVTASTTEYVRKEDGNGYGYLWTVYRDGHYAALGLGGQQIHVYPSQNLIVVVTSALESFAGTPEIETLLNDFILPSVRSERPLPGNPDAYASLQDRVERAANPVQAVLPLPDVAHAISGSTYTFEENLLGWQTMQFNFEDGSSTASLELHGLEPLEVGLDNIYRLSQGEAIGELFLRGRWIDERTFAVDYPYPAAGPLVLGELGETVFTFKFTGDMLEVTVQELIFGGEPLTFKGSR